MKGFLHRTPTGGITAALEDRIGYRFVLTGTPRVRDDGVRGYDIEVVMTGVPADLALPGDEQNFEVIAPNG